MKITDEIFQVGGGRLTAPEDAAIYLIHFDGRAALVDGGCGGSIDKLFKNIQACGVSPKQIEMLLITHCHFDHTGGAAAIRKKTGCRLAAHALDAPFLEQGDDAVTAASWYGAALDPFPIDVKLTGDSETILLGKRKIAAFHMPGHSPGSVVYLTESEGLKVLFAQDVHGPLDESLLSDHDQYRRSLERMLALEADVLCEGHYGVFYGKKKVAGFIRSFL